ncbi:hypothetical protein CABS01_16399 [Colletotrichum abscissum]|uniref:uncharacterized protein n=1 Tax=Colletotrichum abscissum TaxID=1671311 RepID=UPI0027D60C2F|nr:uncharacterized protein CABS01_16399 [Colletotrichum abscissum]KAK1471313.1 hypothetical protein CABS01_16399 [Colletotrichum abscissum]
MLCEGITIGRRVWDNDNPETGRFEHELAVALGSCGEYRQALDLIPGAVDKLNRCLGPRHPDTLTATYTMGVLYKDLGLLGDAAAKFEDVLRRSEEAFPDGNIHLLRSRSSLAYVRSRQGRLAESVETQRHVLETMGTQFGDAHPDTLTAMADLAETLRWTGDTAEAAGWYGLVFNKMSETFDKDAPDMIEALSDYANSLLDGGKTIEAREKLAEVGGGTAHESATRSERHKRSILRGRDLCMLEMAGHLICRVYTASSDKDRIGHPTSAIDVGSS